jgi:hypothetical protein
MLFTTLLDSVRNTKRRWLISGTIAILTTLVSHSSAALADSLNRMNVTPSINGVYLYGESDRPDVVGKEYLIFETIGTKTIGAFYLPKSEFSCFKGQFQRSRLNVTLTDTFDRQKYNFTLNLNPSGLTASKQPMMGEPSYQPLGKVSDNDRRMLDTCKVQLAN